MRSLFRPEPASWPPALLGLPRAVLALSLACLVMTLLPAPAEASYWTVSITDSGKSQGNESVDGGTPTIINWTPPADAQNSNSFSFGSQNAPTLTGKVNAAHFDATINAKITLTWHADPATDPAPTSIMIAESASSTATAQTQFNPPQGDPLPITFTVSGSDGLSGTGVTGSFSATATGSWQRPPPAQSGSVFDTPFSPQSVNGGVVTFNRVLKCSADASGHSVPGATASVSYKVSIHAQPYNYQKVPGGGNMGLDGSLSFTYDWSSTTGNKNDLTSCFWHEYVLYPGKAGTAANPNLYSPPSPPFSTIAYPNPTVSPGTGPSGGAMTGTNRVVDTQGVPPFVPPSLYTYGTFTATQVYEFDDTATGETNVQIPGPDSGLFSIVREFKLYDAHDYIYTCTKDNHTASVLKSF